jgi:hypothetical protein
VAASCQPPADTAAPAPEESARVDLNGDGQDEVVAYIAGPMICGAGSCPVYVFTPRDLLLAQVGNVIVAHTPILLAATSTNCWRDLIVCIGGGGIQSSHALIRCDGANHPANATVSLADPAADTESAEFQNCEFASYKDGKPLQGGPSQLVKTSHSFSDPEGRWPAQCIQDRELTSGSRRGAPLRSASAIDGLL